MTGLERERLDLICALRLAEPLVRRRARAATNVTLRREREAKADRMARLRERLEAQAEAVV